MKQRLALPHLICERRTVESSQSASRSRHTHADMVCPGQGARQSLCKRVTHSITCDSYPRRLTFPNRTQIEYLNLAFLCQKTLLPLSNDTSGDCCKTYITPYHRRRVGRMKLFQFTSGINTRVESKEMLPARPETQRQGKTNPVKLPAPVTVTEKGCAYASCHLRHRFDRTVADISSDVANV